MLYSGLIFVIQLQYFVTEDIINSDYYVFSYIQTIDLGSLNFKSNKRETWDPP